MRQIELSAGTIVYEVTETRGVAVGPEVHAEHHAIRQVYNTGYPRRGDKGERMPTGHHPMALRIGLGIAAVAALITTTTSVAHAEGSGHRVPLGNTPADIPADVCGFPIHIGVVDDREYRVQQTDNPDGSITVRVTGTLINSLTNLDTGTTINYNNGGPGTFVWYPDGHFTLDFQGHSMEWIRAEHQAQLGTPAFRLTSGHVVGTANASGDIVDLSATGNVVDGCALLSSDPGAGRR